MTAPPRPGGQMRSAVSVVERWALALLIAVGLVAWGIGIARKGYDYDEVQRAHSVWLVSQGLRPYVDMFEVHPPYFVLLTPLLSLSSDPCDTLRVLRLFAAMGNLAFLAGLVALGWSPGARSGRWALLGVAFVAFHPKVLDFLVEYRIDGWGCALLAWSVVLFLRRPRARLRFTTFGILSGLATLLLCPKLALLPPLVVGVAVMQGRPPWRDVLRSGAGYLLGVGLAGVLFGLFLAANRISPERTYDLLFRYHTLSNANSAYRNGLVRQIAATPLLLGPIVLGALACAWTAARRALSRVSPPAAGEGRGGDGDSSTSGGYPLALAVWLAIQAVMVAYHYKQYYAPWFLFASTFVVLLGRALDGLWRPLAAAAFLAACGATIAPTWGIAALWDRYDPARGHCATIRALAVLAPPGDRVVAPPPEHPIARHDTFFLWFSTSDPEGYDSERILEELDAYRALVSDQHYRTALRDHPPALVVLDSGPVAAPYPAGQWRALRAFLPQHGYRAVHLGNLRIALHPDRYEQFRGTGIFVDDPGPLEPVMPAAG